MKRAKSGLVVLALCVLSVSACSSGPGPVTAASSPSPTRSGFVRSSATPPPVRAFPAFSATATKPSVVVRTTPAGPVKVTLANPQPSGAPLVFLVAAQEPGWLQVQLPVRPNGSTGWVKASDVTLSGLAYRLDVRRGAHRLDVYRYDVLEKTYPVGIGTAETPTPGGTFYLKELLTPPTKTGPYGPFAYGLSGFSNALTSFAGGDGVIGIHGTNEPRLVGTDVSHGCIRMRNADITELAKQLPLGTPVRILA